MKKSDLRKIIKEEISNMLNEDDLMMYFREMEKLEGSIDKLISDINYSPIMKKYIDVNPYIQSLNDLKLVISKNEENRKRD
tara:strand:- start:1124 stop:1366 length:243 start_codon:yes stop_codon:yes gene_type:complete